MKKFNKRVVASYEFKQLECFVLDDGEYFNIHIIDPKYKSDELNTLRLQEPKVDLINHDNFKDEDTYFTDERLMGYILEHYLWDFAYGHDSKLWNFSVEAFSDKL